MAVVNTWCFQYLTLHITNYTWVTFGAEGLSLFMKNKILFLVIYIKNELYDNYAQIWEENKKMQLKISELYLTKCIVKELCFQSPWRFFHLLVTTVII